LWKCGSVSRPTSGRRAASPATSRGSPIAGRYASSV
jgi:hypothetical protein